MGNRYIRNTFFLTAVLILGLSLAFSGCGGTLGKSMIKTLAEAGPYAIYFPGIDQPGFYNFINAKTKNTPLSGGEVTVEAWIKIEDPVNGGGTILARGQEGFGISLDVSNSGLASFAVDSQPVISTAPVNDGSWHHVAGMLVGSLPVGEQHNHATSANCTTLVMGSLHLDIYVDGFFNDCSSSAYPSIGVDACTDPDGIPVACTNYIGRDLATVFTGSLFRGIIDEIRVWKEARSPGQIQKWMDEEISGEDWDTADPDNKIIGYWKFNEGTGDTVIDSSGYGHNGSRLICASDCGTQDEVTLQWLDGWVEGYPF